MYLAGPRFSNDAKSTAKNVAFDNIEYTKIQTVDLAVLNLRGLNSEIKMATNDIATSVTKRAERGPEN